MAFSVRTSAFSLALAFTLSACAQPKDETAEATASATENLTEASFGCIRDLTQVNRFFVGNLDGDLEATVAVASSEDGGVFPVGSVVQLVPGEAMVKRASGFNADTKNWEFFEFDVSPEGTSIRNRGHVDVVNRFDGNCLECHEKAEERFDMICSTDNGCDPIPINDAMIRALQKTDPRCGAPLDLTAEESEGLAALMAATGG